ncbi:MAG: right-handed parallel beta-helix repeat-containing protein [Acidobacteriota bacterium]
MSSFGAVIEVDSSCSLMDAISSANSDTSVGTCNAGSGTDFLVLKQQVRLDTALPGDNGTPTVTSNIIIRGEGLTIFRSSAEDFRLFEVGPTGFLRIENATLLDGRSTARGGAVDVQDGGRLQMVTCNVNDNFAALAGGAVAVGSGSEVDLIRCNFLNNTSPACGGLFNRGDAFLVDTHYEGNSNTVAAAGVLTNSGTMDMVRCSIFDNQGIDSIIENFGDLTMTESLMDENTSDGVGFSNRGTATLSECNFADNVLGSMPGISAGIRNDGMLTADATLVLSNSPSNCSGTDIIDLGGNIDDDGTCFTNMIAACCLGSSCSLETLDDCTALGGTFGGEGVPCTELDVIDTELRRVQATSCASGGCLNLDFNGLAPGTEVGTQFQGVTISGSAPVLSFDTGAPTCGDDDLLTPGPGPDNGAMRQGVLILSESFACVPNDSQYGGTFYLDFDVPSSVASLGLLDIDEAGGEVRAYDDQGGLIMSKAIPAQADNGWQRLVLAAEDVATVEVELVGSGALTEIACSVDAGVGQVRSRASSRARTQPVGSAGGSARGRSRDVADARLRSSDRR